MKKKQTVRPSTPNKKRKIKWNEILITAFAIVTIGGVFGWLVVRIYVGEKHEYEMQETYKASLPSPGISIDHKLVCMVSNTYHGVDQRPVMVMDKTYYSCGEKGTKDIQTDKSVRFAVDPYSKLTVDKALAFITMSPVKPGTILYFESEQNAKQYLHKGL